ncbi:MAG: hypothetical protein [Wendovervirus sonii]|uniref:TonB-dependent receptor n=1 Tax=phage Lak_Megaphage_Sonny TaxID=3109229 RepID=A0ABZ0Z2T5_9CAUD|nr:MAG: hypothetical protein [phage Lak_Megaphage_Sonny]
MKKIFLILFAIATAFTAFANNADTIPAKDTILLNEFTLDEITVTALYNGNAGNNTEMYVKKINAVNVGQEPSHVFKHMPSIYAMSDNGTQFGYGYYRIRGLDQTRINVMLDGMPWNEAEDFGTYFANSPDLMSSMHQITVQRGSSSKANGIAAAAGMILLESVNLKTDTSSHFDLVYGSSNAHKASIVYNMGLKNNWGFHIKATQSGTDGFRDNSQNQSHAITAKVGYFFNPMMSIDFLTMNGYHTNGQGWIGNYEWELKDNKKANGNTAEETDNWFQTVNKINFKSALTDKTLLNACAYLQYQTGSYRMDPDNYTERFEGYNPMTGKLYSYGLTHYMYGGNVIIYDNTVDFMEFTGGVNANWFQRRHFLDQQNAKHMDIEDNYDNTGYKTDINVFGNFNFHATDKFDIGFNLQYRHVDFRYTDNLTHMSIITDSTKWDFLNGGVDLKYVFNNIHSMYAKLAVSSREPTRSTMFDGNEWMPYDIYGNPYIVTRTPELVHDIEFGYNVNHDIISANINLYYMNFTNELILTGTYGPNGLPEHTNAKSSFRTGIEVSFDIEPVNGFHIVNNTSWSKNLINVNNAYKTHVMSPSWTVDQDIHYDFKHVTVGAVYNMRSSIYIDMQNDYKIPANMTLSAYVNTRFFHDKLNVSLQVNNITNRLNYYNGAVGNDGILYFREAGTTFLCSMKYNF